MKKFKADDKGIELPINIVVMLVVGMVALAALLAIIPQPKKNMVVEINSVNNDTGVVADLENGVPKDVSVKLTVYDSNTNNPVKGADVIITGGGSTDAGKTLSTGNASLKLKDVLIRKNQDMLYLKVIVKANGFYDYENDRAILIT
ncbi:MAG TPA: carboxypeptidase regulatory-like domain-containing protein [Candidatus Methanoperedenaceae archaeon]|nr:carboxypeptidase regulatory-like domain-containing protein [Candidatus Methanoperedenaceae archaeon]